MTTNLQQHSDECGYALEALARLLNKYDRIAVETAVGKSTMEILVDYQREHRKIEERNEEINRELAYNFIQSEKSEGQKQWEQTWLDWVEKKNIETQ
jgi:hypothetical protein